jgi:hypothetical protein
VKIDVPPIDLTRACAETLHQYMGIAEMAMVQKDVEKFCSAMIVVMQIDKFMEIRMRTEAMKKGMAI